MLKSFPKQFSHLIIGCSHGNEMGARALIWILQKKMTHIIWKIFEIIFGVRSIANYLYQIRLHVLGLSTV